MLKDIKNPRKVLIRIALAGILAIVSNIVAGATEAFVVESVDRLMGQSEVEPIEA